MVRDKVARVTGEDPQAGVERVRAWVKSPNEYVRGKALSVIEDMKEEDFTVELQVLAADPVDQVLADSAKRELEQREKKKP